MADIGRGAAVEFLAKKFGGRIEEQESAPLVTTSPAVIIGNDPEAVEVLFVNLGLQAAFVALDGRVASTRGIYLSPSGGSAVFTVEEDGTLPAREWWAIASGGGTLLYVLRVRRSSREGG